MDPIEAELYQILGELERVGKDNPNRTEDIQRIDRMLTQLVDLLLTINRRVN